MKKVEKINNKEEQRHIETEEADSKMEENRNNEYYKQFDNRSEEITKDKRGIAYKKEGERRSERWDKETSSEENEVNTTDEDRQEAKETTTQKIPEGLNSEQEAIKCLATKI